MDLGLNENIKNAFEVVNQTYISIEKLLNFLTLRCEDYGFTSITPTSPCNFIRYKSDKELSAGFLRSLFQIYQVKTEERLENVQSLANDFIYGININFYDLPKVTLAKYWFSKMNTWKAGFAVNNYWCFYSPLTNEESFEIKKSNGYYLSVPKNENVINKFYSLEYIVFKHFNLLDLTSENIKERIFDEFNKIPDKQMLTNEINSL